MAPRSNWKGYLKLSLVSCSVALFPATSTSQRVRFNIINRATGNRVHNKIVDADTGKAVDEEDRVKGYRNKGGDYVLLEEDELDRVALESTHTIDIESFVPRDEVDEMFFDEYYYLVPDDAVSEEAYAVIREAMRKEEMVGLGRVVLYRRERLIMLQPRGKGLVATTLRYREEVRDEKDYFDDVPNTKVPAEMLNLAVHILKTKAGHFDPSKFEDRYETALRDLIKAKRAGKELPEPEEARPSNVINLMDALRRSVKAEKEDTPRHRRSKRATARKRTGPRKHRMKKAS